MTQNEQSREELEQAALEALQEREAQSQPYVERPRSQRVLAWILVGVMVLGVALYYGWISGILK